MLNKILNLSEASIISKKNQSSIHGGGFGGHFDCLEQPPICPDHQVLIECACYDR